MTPIWIDTPDPQRVYLAALDDAINDAADQLIAAGLLDREDFAGLRDDEPQALAFTGADMEGWTEDDHESALLAMERDMTDRIHARQRTLDRLREIATEDPDA